MSLQTQNNLQTLLNSFDFNNTNLYDIADSKTKRRINTYIEEWKDKGLLKGYFGTLAKSIYGRTRVKNSEILELLIYSAYIEEQSRLDKQEQQIFKEDASYYYQQGIEEVNKTLPKNKQKIVSIIPDAIFLALLDRPNYSGFNFEQYIDILIRYNTEQIYKQVVYNIQQQRELDIASNEFQNIIAKQNNQKLNINGDKISGAIDMQMIGLNNQAKIEGIKSIYDEAKVIFLAEIDGKETPMCHSLHRQEFYISKENEFNRYYGETPNELNIQRIKCKGLVLGLNLPPISHHFHWCRSTVQYIPSIVEKGEKEEYNIDNFLRTKLYKNKDYNEYISDYEKVRNEYEKLPDNIKKRLFGEEKVKVIFNYDGEHSGYNYNTKEILLNPDIEDGEFIHEVGHALEYILDLHNNPKYIEISNKLFDNNFKEPKFDKDEIYYGLQDESKFISSYQTYLGKDYNEYIKNYNNKFLRELISESYRDIYSDSSILEKTNKELYDFIREIEKNA